ncbi:VanZ family protein [bacterium]|nr:MAG: VanZ family protein [bacterium]
MRKWAPWLWYGLIFATSSTVIHRNDLVAAVPVPAREGFDLLWGAIWLLVVKGWHMAEFAILFLLAHRSIRAVGPALIWVVLAAVLDEFHQTFVPGRGGRFTDVLIDLTGASIAAMIVVWRFGPRPSKTLMPSVN